MNDGLKHMIAGAVIAMIGSSAGGFLVAMILSHGIGYKPETIQVGSVNREVAPPPSANTAPNTNSLAAQVMPGVKTNLTLSGILTKEILVETNLANGTLALMRVYTSDRGGDTNRLAGIPVDKKLVRYVVTMPDGTSVGFGSTVAKTSPSNIEDYLNQSVTIDGPGCKGYGRSGKLTRIDCITSITKNADSSSTNSTPRSAQQ